MSLQRYKEKRKFEHTPEPRGSKATVGRHRYVVQRHDARRLHYDLRLELDGVLKSWAVPKGPSMNPEDKRLAVHTEDHPIEYLSFEGTIPKGNYGAGQMDIWDSGTFSFYENKNDGEALKALDAGHLKVTFDGTKLKGKFALVRTRKDSKADQWLLIKKKDEFASDTSSDPDEMDKLAKPLQTRQIPHDLGQGTQVKPMLATSTKKIFDDPDWIYEIKWDGYRMISHVLDGEVQMYSRRGQSFLEKFAPIRAALADIPHDVVLDGEVVIVDKNGIPHFQLLQNYDQNTIGELRYYVFDMLYLNGHDITSLPLTERKSLLPSVLEGLQHVVYCDHIAGRGKGLYQKLVSQGMEGVIAKKSDAPYLPGVRSEQWLKIKAVETMDAIICGYTDSVNGGAIFGSLILGKYEDGRYSYIGNCGTGFSNADQKALLKTFENLETPASPFESNINLKGRKPHWVRPELVCEVKYADQTASGLLRHPVFKGLRPDKSSFDATETKMNNTKKDTINPKSAHLEVEGHAVQFTNLDKIYWPESGLTKYDLIDYYLEVAGTMLKYQKDRPQNLHRHPDGIAQKGFYHKDMENVPDWAETTSIYSESANKQIDYLLCQNEATLLYMANLGCVEINPWNARTSQLDFPDYGIIDLDPSDSNTFEEVIEVAQVAGEILSNAKIDAYSKTSGSTGLHIFIPMGARYEYELCRSFVKFICYLIWEKMPTITSMERS